MIIHLFTSVVSEIQVFVNQRKAAPPDNNVKKCIHASFPRHVASDVSEDPVMSHGNQRLLCPDVLVQQNVFERKQKKKKNDEEAVELNARYVTAKDCLVDYIKQIG